MFKTFRQQETVGCNAQGGVMMKATPAPSLVVAQAEFLFKLLIVPLNAPAHLGAIDQIYQRGISGQRRQPILGGFSLILWPFDQQPLILTWSAKPSSSRCAARTRTAAKRDDNFSLVPWRQTTVCHRRARNVSLTFFTLSGVAPGTRCQRVRGRPILFLRLGGTGPVPAAHTVVTDCTPTQYSNPISLSASRHAVSLPYPASASTMPTATPAALAARICSSAIWGLVRNFTVRGTPDFFLRRRSLAHTAGKYSRQSIGTLPHSLANDRLTAT